jgi:hypothetical protein
MALMEQSRLLLNESVDLGILHEQALALHDDLMRLYDEYRHIHEAFMHINAEHRRRRQTTAKSQIPI